MQLDPSQRSLWSKMTYIFPVVTFGFMSGLPALTQIMFATTGVITFVQTKAFQNAAFRQYIGIHPLPATPVNNNLSYKGKISQFKPPTVEKEPLWERLQFWRNARSKAEDLQARNQERPGRLSKAQRANAERYEKQRRSEIEAEIVNRERARRRL